MPQPRHEPVPEEKPEVLRVRPQGALCSRRQGHGIGARISGKRDGLFHTPSIPDLGAQSYSLNMVKPELLGFDSKFLCPIIVNSRVSIAIFNWNTEGELCIFLYRFRDFYRFFYTSI